MSEYIVKLPTYGAADEFFKTHEMPDMTLYGYPLTGEIVRCRDCVGLYETWDGWECERFSGEYHRAEPDGFCSWSCRRSDKE